MPLGYPGLAALHPMGLAARLVSDAGLQGEDFGN